ncbi:MAG TPA: hypothetical protein VMT33_07250 [Candidatus Bathyarchaeia archaeon]|nr:hypothetical protein [Candidatus Bathyarchaeia archaeon]
MTLRAAIALLAFSLAACGASVSKPEDPRKAALDKHLSARVEMGQWSGAVLVAVGDRVLLRRADEVQRGRSDRPPVTRSGVEV